MKYGGIKFLDVSNGPGIRTSLFVSGCTHHCKGCFNEETWDFSYGNEYTDEVEGKITASLSSPHVAGLTVLGGEPMELSNQPFVRKLLERVRTEYPEKSLWVYSGYTFEELTDRENKRCHGEHTDAILGLIDVLVDGKFVLLLKDISLKFRGSGNQRIIDMKSTLREGKIILSKYM